MFQQPVTAANRRSSTEKSTTRACCWLNSTTKSFLTILLNRDFVKDIIGDLSFDVCDGCVHSSWSQALFLFKENKDTTPDGNMEQHRAKIDSFCCFEMGPGFVPKGKSFRCLSRSFDIAREVTNLCYLKGCGRGV